MRSFGRGRLASASQAAAAVPVLGVLLSAPLAYIDPSGKVLPMETLDFDKEKVGKAPLPDQTALPSLSYS